MQVNTLAARLEYTLHQEIPLSREMGIAVTGYDGKRLTLSAPLAPNINHKCTAFGGSLYSLAVLCGWGMVHIKLEEAGLHRHIVIQQADIDYLLPVAEDMQAECSIEQAALDRFMSMLKKHGRGRLTLEVSIKRDQQLAVTFTGRYVVHE